MQKKRKKMTLDEILFGDAAERAVGGFWLVGSLLAPLGEFASEDVGEDVLFREDK